MNKLSSPIGLIFLAIVGAIARLFLLCKIYAVLAPVFGGPALSMRQMLALLWFMGCTDIGTSATTAKQSSTEAAGKLIGSLIGLLIALVLARLIFGV